MSFNKRASPPLSSSGLIIERIRRVVILATCYLLLATSKHGLAKVLNYSETEVVFKAAFTLLNSNPKPSYTIWWTLSVLKDPDPTTKEKQHQKH